MHQAEPGHAESRNIIVMGACERVHRHVASSGELDLIVGQLLLDLLAVAQGVEDLQTIRGLVRAELHH